MANPRKSIMLNIGTLNRKLRSFEEKKNSIEQSMEQLRKARGKLITRLKTIAQSEKHINVDNNSRIKVKTVPKDKENVGSNLEEKLLLEFYDDFDGDRTVIEATKERDNFLEIIAGFGETSDHHPDQNIAASPDYYGRTQEEHEQSPIIRSRRSLPPQALVISKYLEEDNG